MGTLIVFTIALVAAFGTVHCGPDAKIVQDFCENILLQSQPVTDQCYHKPRGYKFVGDNAVLYVICCLGYLGEVTNNYTRYLSLDFAHFVANLTNDKHVLNIGKFVMMCKNETKTLNPADFFYWCSNGKTTQVCTSR